MNRSGRKLGHIGKKTWMISEGYIPSYGTGSDPEFTSHETAYILNIGETEAHIGIYIYFDDREPVGPYGLPLHREEHTIYVLTTSKIRSPYRWISIMPQLSDQICH